MRYILLVALNLPAILMALVDIVTKYKLKKVSKRRFRHQIILWTIILVVLLSSFPVYNLLMGRPTLDSQELSFFDIAEITAIVYLIYVINNQRQKIERNEKMTRDLHQELSIKLSSNDGKS